ncbi:unnamed protein product [Dibothriocephalus latus]|uniref:Beta-1,4-galactosyltransferase n=1 Tax=Dibothriocephalus latus TaxID=60516 RepID=A0A3P7NTW9_DIBLA|nr:unnamed protein product [Dibothriocephalus latus]
MQYVEFDRLALKWGVPSEMSTWSGASNFTDIKYTLGYHPGNGIQPARVVWSPASCYQPEATAIIIPFRNRFVNLSVFLDHMHPFLRHQRRRYTIFVIDQAVKHLQRPLSRQNQGALYPNGLLSILQVTPKIFNRAALLNIGFREAVKSANYSCFIFHDVDLLPEDDRMIYGCEDQPLHMSATIDKFNYSLFYKTSFGGAVAMTRTQFEKALGYANTYFGWGCEDDDMYRRLTFSNQTLVRRNFTFARYKMMKHPRDAGNEENPERRRRLKQARQLWQHDTYDQVQYLIRRRELKDNGLDYYFQVDILHPNVGEARAEAESSTVSRRFKVG